MEKINVSKLGYAEVIVDIVPKGNFEIRPAYQMNPTQIAIHNTGNAGRGAGAKAHNVYIHNMAKKQPKDTGYASWHFSVDDKFIYQHIPLTESAWHTGDGSRPTSGNRTAIGIEICENPETDTQKAEENAIALTVWLMKTFNISLDKVKPHQAFSGKYCPRVILKRDGTFDKFKGRIAVAFEGPKEEENKPATCPCCGQVLPEKPKPVEPTVKPVEAVKPVEVVKPIEAVKKPVEAVKPAITIVKEGANGQEVKDIQYMLIKVNKADLKVDGDFGPATKKAVMEYQAKKKLVADGIVGPKTMAILKAEYEEVIKPQPMKETGKGVISSDVWTHNKPTTTFDTSTRVKVLAKGETVTIYGEAESVYKIGANLYVSKKYVIPTVKPEAKTGKAIGDVWLHSKADYEENTRTVVLKQDETVGVYGEENGMYKVRHKNKTAYVSKKYIKLT